MPIVNENVKEQGVRLSTEMESAPAAFAEAKTPIVVPNLGQRAFSGAVWTLAQILGTKVSAISSQLLLAAILSPDDFGCLAEIVLIVSLAALGQQLGLAEILIRRHRNINKWLEIAFWISLATGLLGARRGSHRAVRQSLFQRRAWSDAFAAGRRDRTSL